LHHASHAGAPLGTVRSKKLPPFLEYGEGRMAKKQPDWRLVSVISNGRIRTGRYNVSHKRLTVEYAGSIRIGRFIAQEHPRHQAEKLLRTIVEMQLAPQ